MRIGMLWFDDNHSRNLAEKVERAVEHYQAKYGLRPTLCYVHPSMLLKATSPIAGVDVRGSNTVLPNHLWIGRGEEAPQRAAA
jgi:hypothetical protein